TPKSLSLSLSVLASCLSFPLPQQDLNLVLQLKFTSDQSCFRCSVSSTTVIPKTCLVSILSQILDLEHPLTHIISSTPSSPCKKKKTPSSPYALSYSFYF
ncbi:hypothetical protein F2P56_015889, partial [Juglans regia]